MYRHHLLGCSLVALLAGGAQAEIAEQSADILVTAHAQSLEQVTSTGSRLGITVLDTPASVESLSGDVIRQRGDLSIVEAVTRATGISNDANPGNGGVSFAARGFNGSGSVQILYDGVRLYPGAGTTTFPVDPWMVEQIDVLRGPASVLYGEGSIGGAINIISRKPNTERMEVEGSAGFGSQDTWRASAGIGGPINPVLSYRVDASARGSDGYVDRGRSRSLALSGSLRFAPTDNFSLTLSDDHGKTHPIRYFGTPLLGGVLDQRNRDLNYNVRDSQLSYEDNWLRLKAEWEAGGGISVENQVYRITTDRTFRNLEGYAYGGSGATPRVDRFDYIGIRHQQRQIGDQGSVTLHSNLGQLKNDLVLGFDVNSIRFTHSNNSPYPGGDDVDAFNFAPGFFFYGPGIIPRYRTKTLQYALFAEDRLQLTPELSLVGGVRYDHARIKRYNLVSGNTPIAATPVIGFPKTFRNVGWRGGIVYKPEATLSFYAQYATGQDPLTSLITTGTAQLAFKQAKGRQAEVGVKNSFGNGLGEVTLALYHIKKSNLLARIAGQPSASQQQVGERSSRGVEASVSLNPVQDFGIDANIAVLNARFDDFNDVSGGQTVQRKGNTPPNVPQVTGNLWLRWDATQKLQARAGLRYVGRTYSDNANQFRVPGYTVVDGGASYALTDRIALNVRVFNLFDKVYATTTYNDEQYILGRPRSYEVSVDFRF